ncbi:MAG: MazG nucleotide pyrophosphohydrolase domain-containing protein [Pseudomonadota bacterium]|nr:MazG nucleotide pyrophosphohydrolase domain-containing protein [Pseudomonadota bacterium]
MSETSIEKLLELMRQLRDPDNGCEWDKKQTFESLLPYLDEEAKEVTEAIKNKDYINLKEELGDLLLQIIFHSEIAKEKKLFSFNDVVNTLSDKLIRRHPYVFDLKRKHTASEQAKMWKQIKDEEKK